MICIFENILGVLGLNFNDLAITLPQTIEHNSFDIELLIYSEVCLLSKLFEPMI